jgi:hypothetical protein
MNRSKWPNVEPWSWQAQRVMELIAAQGRRHVERQRNLVENLAYDSHDITEHADQLKQFQELLALHIQERDRLRKQLAEKPISFRGPQRQLGD